MKQIFVILLLSCCTTLPAQVGWGDRIKTPREKFALLKIVEAEKSLGLKRENHLIYFRYKQGPKEGFTITTENNETKIEGSDETGLLYGCLEFVSQLKK